ncbi:hypothetical protein EUAN_02620 [Andreesenia angusta]|uniref:DUF1819 family protein n=1 Tax=Andreesenia angusta TaxID=39480 RepID=A0A1S1V9Z5_9FIRM|nr:hypothetical protein [Andreesenia angusta]OHW63398.1 hypothetical protein EUAN_02620 [Andreesenia angusta]
MAKMIGMSRGIKLEWLDKTVDLIIEGKNEEDIKSELNEYLSFEIKSATNLRKSREILMNIWVRTADDVEEIKEFAIELCKRECSSRRVAHWCMMLITYPVFSDVCSLIGKITDMQEKFKTGWLKQKLFDFWGESSTLLHSTDKILQTLKQFGAIESLEKGEYKAKTYEVKSEAEESLIAMTIIALNDKAYYEVSELSSIPQMFPFRYSISHEMLHNSELFALNNFGGKVVVTGKD